MAPESDNSTAQARTTAQARPAGQARAVGRSPFRVQRRGLIGALLGVAALLPIGILGGYSFYLQSRATRDMVRQGNAAAARLAAEVVNRELENSVSLAVATARQPELVAAVGRHDEAAVRQRLVAAVESFPRVDRLTVLDPQGQTWCDYPHDPQASPHDFSHRDYFLGMARHWQPYVSEVFRRVAAPQPMIVAVSAPVWDDNHKPLGGIICQYRLEALTACLKECTVGQDGYVLVIDYTGKVAAHPRMDLQSGLHTEYAELEPVGAARAGTASTLEYDDPVAGQSMVATFWPLPVTGHSWVIVAQQPLASAYAPIRRLGWNLAGATGLLVLAAAAVVVAMNRVQQQLRRAKIAAETASRAKSTFLANMSHEIRTPLNAVIGMTELVLKTPLAAQQREFLLTVRDSGEALLSVINDILDFSKIEAGKLELDPAPFDLRESLGDTMKSFAIRAHQLGLELACFIHPDVPRRLVGDYSRLRQVVVNLVGNALKFTERGEVTLEVNLQSRMDREAVLHFTVTDTGMGIPADKQLTIFEMFEQADATTTRRHGGTGLGLPIALRLVARMGGWIWVESQVGVGSKFHFIVPLPLADDEPPQPAPPEPASLHGLRVLAVDDNATNCRIIEEILRSWRMEPVVACDAIEALDRLREAQAGGRPFRLVLTDAHMPGADGFMLTRQIRTEIHLASPVVMMLTSGDRPEDGQHCRELGIAAYLLKPFKQSELLEAIEEALGMTMGPPAPAPQDDYSSVPADLRILLAEDSLVNQKLAVALLEEQGHRVSVAVNGRDAVTQALATLPDLILMDVQMPELDGLEATAEIRAAEAGGSRHVPIVAMTAHALKGDRERCLGAGMDGYIAKPIRAAELFVAIARLFPATDTEPAAGTAPPSTAAPRPDGGVNWDEALRSAQGNAALLDTMVQAELAEAPRLLETLRAALAGGDRERLRAAAHTLKGSVRYFGAGLAVAAAVRLEELAPAGDWNEIEAQQATLAEGLRQLLAELRQHAARASSGGNPFSGSLPPHGQVQ